MKTKHEKILDHIAELAKIDGAIDEIDATIYFLKGRRRMLVKQFRKVSDKGDSDAKAEN